jgi:multiple sugar transport system permease protein
VNALNPAVKLRDSRLPAWKRLGLIPLYLFVAGGALLSVYPFVFMVLSSFKTTTEIFRVPPTFLPAQWRTDTYPRLVTEIEFGRWFFNSVFIAGLTTLGVLFFSSLAGFAFAKYRFPGRNVMFVTLMASSLIPFSLILIPLFLWISRIGWINSYAAIIIPFLAPAGAIFLMRQFITQIPTELLEAARMDGASEFRIYWQVVLPLLGPALGTQGTFTFLGAWNNFLWPFIVISARDKFTLPMGLRLLSTSSAGSAAANDMGVIMAGAAAVAIPSLIVFLFVQRQFIAGLLQGSVKQ